MDIPASKWARSIKVRRSKRRYKIQPLNKEIINHLINFCENFRPFPTARAVLIEKSPDRLFRGLIGQYGKIKGFSTSIAFIGDMTDRYIQEKVGYTGEGIVLEATTMELGTCWVGGFFRRNIAEEVIGVKENERVLSITPVGITAKESTFEDKIMEGFGRHHKRKHLDELASGISKDNWPDWIKNAVNLARLAPSAVNRQPWRFQIEDNSIIIAEDSKRSISTISKRLDCGIAMLHLEVGALASGVKGKWDFLESPNVARFTVIN